MNTIKISPKFVYVLVLVAILVTACAPASGVQELSPASRTAAAMIEAAQDEQLIRNAAQTATAMAGGVIPNTEVVVQPTPVIESTPIPPTAHAPAQPNAPQICQKINDYQLQDLPELSVEPGGFLHVQWYVKDGDPERESVLPSGRYLIKTPLRGHVWEYSPTCTPDQVLEQVAESISRRLDVGADNAGYAPWQEWLVGKGLIEIVKMTSTSVIPTVLPNPTK
jgi:hypothetical protein